MKKANATMYRDSFTGNISVIDKQAMFNAFKYAFGKITSKNIKVIIKGYKNRIIIEKRK